MRTFWNREWLETPRPTAVPGSTLVEVEATAPIAPLGAAHGRRIDQPLRKLASFALTDGPATIRKARSKRAEPGYSGDYHLVGVVGRDPSDGSRVLGLVPRAPRCADIILVPDALVRSVPDDAGERFLADFAARVRARLPELDGALAQSYLYSSMDPPPALVAVLDDAIASSPDATLQPVATMRPVTAPALDATAEPAGGNGRPPLAVLGAGDYVRIEVAPALPAAALRRAVICDREPQIAALAAARLGFQRAETDAAAAIDSLSERGLVVVATAHDSHAELAARALEAGHRVLCEKPAVVTAADLDRLGAAAAAAPGELEVGFNRRHNPLVERARRLVGAESGPATIVATIREVDITPDHWYLWPNQGTRVAGNLCHWIDLAVHLLGPEREPVAVSVSPRVEGSASGLDAERAFTITFDDGSSATLVPTGRGDSVRGVQEAIEIRRGATTLRLEDLWKLRGLRSGRPIRHRTLWRDKGHSAMYAAVLDRFIAGRPSAYPQDDLRRVSEIQLAATELLVGGRDGGSVLELVAGARERETGT